MPSQLFWDLTKKYITPESTNSKTWMEQVGCSTFGILPNATNCGLYEIRALGYCPNMQTLVNYIVKTGKAIVYHYPLAPTRLPQFQKAVDKYLIPLGFEILAEFQNVGYYKQEDKGMSRTMILRLSGEDYEKLQHISGREL